MADYIIPIVFPVQPITVLPGLQLPLLGHAGAILVNGATGEAVYYDYGRYQAETPGQGAGSASDGTFTGTVADSG